MVKTQKLDLKYGKSCVPMVLIKHLGCKGGGGALIRPFLFRGRLIEGGHSF